MLARQVLAHWGESSWRLPETVLPRLAHAGDAEPRGRGLALVDRLSSGWGVDVEPDASKVVWARFDTGRTMNPEW